MSHNSGQSVNGYRNGHPFSLSPPPRRPRHHDGERVVEKSSSNIVYPTLTQSNYTKWSLVMMVNLQAAGLWDVIESDAGDYREDQSALAALLSAVPQEMQVGLTVKSTAHEAWEAIWKVRLDANRVREANADWLWREFSDLAFKPGEIVEDFSLRLTTVASQLRCSVMRSATRRWSRSSYTSSPITSSRW
jgi:hypothetical protein